MPLATFAAAALAGGSSKCELSPQLAIFVALTCGLTNRVTTLGPGCRQELAGRRCRARVVVD